MMKTKSIIIVIVLITSFIGCNAQNEKKEANFWRNLSPAKYSVGYKVFYEYDDSRTIKSKFDYQKKLITENNYRPVQISVWYPAEVDKYSLPMSYSEYIFSKATRFDYSLLTDDGKEDILNRYSRSRNRYNNSETKNEDVTDYIISRKTQVYKNAAPYEGKFPLILFCSGGGDTPDSFDVLFEYLASHGYVVAAIPSNGMFSNSPSYNLMDEESQIRDMEFAMSFMQSFPNADLNDICSMGYSYGGIINVLFALRNYDINSVLCLDGSICLKDRDRAVKQLPYFDPSRLKIPFMNMARMIHDEQDFSFYNKLKYSDAYLLHFNNLSHVDFKSIPKIRDFEDINSEKNKNISQIGLDNELVYQYALNFLDAYMKGYSTAYEFIQNKPEQNGIANGVLDIDFKKSMEIPPMGKNFIDYFKSEGIEKGLKIYHKAKSNDSTIILFNRNEINNLGYDFLNAGKVLDAIEVFKLFVLEFPNISNSYDSLGEAYAKNNDIEEALRNYRIAFKINPNSQSAAREIKRLEKIK